VKLKFPQVELPSFSDICYATTNRQNAVKNILPEIEKLIIV
jgi:4-hydroxy-3-methylbut-2-enyl diphosphate reductase